MAFDKTEPADDTKIRSLGTVIRPNWVAIQEADSSFIPQALNLEDRASNGALANDPTAIANTMIMYSKQDGAGATQLYAMDPSSNINPLTPTAFTASATGSVTLPGGIIINWGSGTGPSASVVFNTAFTTAAYSIAVSSFNASPTATATVSTFNTTGATLVSTNNNAIYYIAIGK